MAKDKPLTGGDTLRQTRQTTAQTGQVTFQTSQTSTTSSLRLDEDEAMSDEEGVASEEPRPPALPLSHSMTAAMGLSTHRIQVMKASFFGEDREIVRGGGAVGGARTTNYGQPSRGQFAGRMTGNLLARPRHYDTHGGMEQRLGGVQFRDTPSPIPHLPVDTTPSLSSRYLRSHPTPLPTPSHSLLEFAGGGGGEDSTHHISSSATFDLSTSTSLHYSAAAPPRAARWTHPPSAPPTSSLLQVQSSVFMARTDLNTLVPPSDSMVCRHTRLAADIGLFLGRSFRVGWGPNWTLAHSGSGTRPGNSSSSSLCVVVEKVYPTPFMINAPPQKISVSFSGQNWQMYRALVNVHVAVLLSRCLLQVQQFPKQYFIIQPFFEPYLASQLEHSDVKFDSDSPIPWFHPQEGTGLLRAFELLSRHLPTSRDGDSLAQRQMKLLLSLGVALWAELEGAEDSE